MTTSAVLYDVLSQSLSGFWWSVPMLILVYLLLFFFKNPEKISAWSAIMASAFEKISKRSARHSVSSDIQGKISSYIRSSHLDQILPYDIKFKWMHGVKADSYIDEFEVVVIMSYHNNNARNFVTAMRQYTEKGFLPLVRHDMPTDVLIAAELLVQEKMIREKRPDALDIFRNEVAPKQFSRDLEIQSLYDRFKRLDILGYFNNIFLPEIAFVGQRLQGLEFDQKHTEIVEFLNFLENLADEDFPLDYHGDVFHVHVILVAKPFKRYVMGTDPYTKRAKTAMSQKADSIYVAGREHNMDFVDDVVKAIQKERIGQLEWSRNYKTITTNTQKKNAKIALFRL